MVLPRIHQLDAAALEQPTLMLFVFIIIAREPLVRHGVDDEVCVFCLQRPLVERGRYGGEKVLVLPAEQVHPRSSAHG